MNAELRYELESRVKHVLGSRAWSVDIVLRVGAELAQCVNKVHGLSGRQKADAVLQTIQKLLEDGEKAEKELKEESTGTVTTTIPWEECKMVATQLLPVTLDLIIDAARGRLDLKKVGDVARVGCSLLPFLCCSKKSVAATQAGPALTVRQPSHQSPNLVEAVVTQHPLTQDTQAIKDIVLEQQLVHEKESSLTQSSNVVSLQSTK
jgi:hypothetical protein